MKNRTGTLNDPRSTKERLDTLEREAAELKVLVGQLDEHLALRLEIASVTQSARMLLTAALIAQEQFERVDREFDAVVGPHDDVRESLAESTGFRELFGLMALARHELVPGYGEMTDGFVVEMRDRFADIYDIALPAS
jgi:hypothetical protein